jgi:hypothetical protein
LREEGNAEGGAGHHDGDGGFHLEILSKIPIIAGRRIKCGAA